MVRSKRELAIFLSRLELFKKPDRKLEQYPTDSDVAASLLWHAYMDGAITGRSIVDLGCGTGILSVGALLLGASDVLMVDIDADVKPIIERNMQILFDEYFIVSDNPYSFLDYDVSHLSRENVGEEVTVVTNPPFGTSITHADTNFLTVAFSLSSLVYSIHKTSTISHIRKLADKEGFSIGWSESTRFRLSNTLAEHRRQTHRIDVTLFSFIRE